MPSAEPRIFQVATRLVAGLADRHALASIAAGRDWFGQGRQITEVLRETAVDAACLPNTPGHGLKDLTSPSVSSALPDALA